MFFTSKTIRIVTAFCLFLSVAVFSYAAEEKKDNPNVAMVNGDPITETDFNREMTVIKNQFMRRGRTVTDEQMETIKGDVLDNLIGQKLIYMESQKKGVKVTPEEVEQQFNDLKSRFQNEEQFEQMLTDMKLTEDRLKEELKRRIASKKLIDDVIVKDIAVSDEEAKDYYEKTKDNFRQPERIKASHILIKVEPEADQAKKDEARKKIEEVLEMVNNGGDFAELAKKYSEGPSGANGGDLGFFGKGQMVEPFEKAAFALKPGEVSGIVETKFGYHIIKAVDKQPETVISYDEIKDRIMGYLQQEKIQQKVLAYVQDLRDKAKVEIF